MGRLSIVLFILAVAPNSGVADVVLRSVGGLPGHSSSALTAVNWDGTIVVGYSWSLGAGPWQPFRWTARDGILPIECPATWQCESSMATGVSGDGTVVCGYCGTGTTSGHWPWRYTESEGVVMLQQAPQWGGWSTTSTPSGISADGSVIVGSTDHPGPRPFRWVELAPPQDIGGTEGIWSYASGICADGSTACGATLGNSGSLQYFRACKLGNGEPILLAGLSAGQSAWGSSISADGLIVAGTASGADFAHHAVRWVAADAPENLELTPHPAVGGPITDSDGVSLSGDGRVVVGNATTSRGVRAMFWTPARGMVLLNDHLASLGVPTDGWALEYARAISSDGTAIGGSGTFGGVTTAFLITGLHLVPDPCVADLLVDGVVDGIDLAAVLQAWGTSGGTLGGDIDGDGMVNGPDLAAIMAGWGPCPQ